MNSKNASGLNTANCCLVISSFGLVVAVSVSLVAAPEFDWLDVDPSFKVDDDVSPEFDWLDVDPSVQVDADVSESLDVAPEFDWLDFTFVIGIIQPPISFGSSAQILKSLRRNGGVLGVFLPIFIVYPQGRDACHAFDNLMMIDLKRGDEDCHYICELSVFGFGCTELHYPGISLNSLFSTR